jgi:hypothetical protein
MEPLDPKDAQRYTRFKQWTPYEAALLLAGCKPLPRGHIPKPKGNTPAFNLIYAVGSCGPSKNLKTRHSPEVWMNWYGEYIAGYKVPEFSEMAVWAYKKYRSELAMDSRLQHVPSQNIEAANKSKTTLISLPDKSVKDSHLKTKSPERLRFESNVLNFMTDVWNEWKINQARDNTLTEPTKGIMHAAVLNKLLDINVKSKNKSPTLQMVTDAAKPWKKPALPPVKLPSSVAPEKRHHFKGGK